MPHFPKAGMLVLALLVAGQASAQAPAATSRDSRGGHVGAGRREIEVSRLARLRKRAAPCIHGRHGDNAGIGCRILRRRRGSVVADGGHDFDAARLHSSDCPLQQFVRGPDQADVDHLRAMSGESAERLHDHRGGAGRLAAAIDVGDIELRARRRAMERPLVADKQGCHCRCSRSATTSASPRSLPWSR